MNFSTFNCIQNTLKVVVPLLGLTSLILLSNQNLNFYKHISKLSLPNENIGVKNESQFAKIRKAILVSPMFKAVPGYAGEFPENCSVTCDIYQYKEIKPTEIGKVDAIMFHLKNIDMELMRPFLSQSDSRPEGQIWTIFTSEPAIKQTKLGQDRYVKNGIFNWTISFRSDSTIPTISKRIVEFQNVTNKPKEKFRHLQILDKFNISRLETKKRHMAAVISNCKNSFGRLDVIKELQSFGVTVDIYGKCSPNGLTCLGRMSTECYEMLEEKYYFYAAFENSNCKDYVTEKLVYPLHYDMVPVTLNGASKVLKQPSENHLAFIDAMQFSSVEELAIYLKRVAADRQLYQSFFEWKNHYGIVKDETLHPLCALCLALQDGKQEAMNATADLDHWYHVDSECQKTIRFNKTSKST